MSDTNQVKLLSNIVWFDKGKPPAQQSYFGKDAELYLSPEYLRGNAEAELIKPGNNAIRVVDGDTIVLWDGSNAGEIFRAKKGILASTMTRINHGNSFDNEYFFYALKHKEEYLKGQTSGSGIPHVDKEVLGNIELYEFKMPEQEKIAQVLSTVDQAIEQTEALIAKQQRIKTGIMQDLLSKGVDRYGNLRSEETHEFKDSPLGRIPVEWEVEVLSTRVVVKGGKRLPAGHIYAESDTNFRYLRTMDFIKKRINYDSLNFLFRKTFFLLERYEIIDGDVFISIAGVNLGVSGVFRPKFNDRTILTENAAKLVCVKDDIPEYLSLQLNGLLIQKQILEDKGVGAGVPKLALHRIQHFIIPWPRKDEQKVIVKHLEKFDEYMKKQQRLLLKLKSIKTALMQDLLTGKIRVTPLLKTKTQ